MQRKLGIGTVQFGLRYGVANSTGQAPPAEAARILARAARAGVTALDTAIAYGNSEEVLGAIGVSGWEIVTKLPPLPDGIEDCKGWVHDEALGSLRRLKVSRLDGLLLHRPADLLGVHGPAYRDALADLQRNGSVRDVGVSIYRPDELEALWPVFRPQLVQAPLSVIDRRLETSGWLSRLAGEGVRVHTRSAFLQGLLLMPAEKLPAYFQPWAGLLDGWLQWCAQAHATPLAAALQFCLQQPHVERVVTGVDSLDQLEDILAAARVPVPLPPAALACEDGALIEPPQWKL